MAKEKDWKKDLSRIVMVCDFIPFETREKLSNGLLILPDSDIDKLIDLLAKLTLNRSLKILDEIARNHEASVVIRNLINDTVKNEKDDGGKNGS